MADGEAGGVVGDQPQGVLVVLVGGVLVLGYHHGVDGKAAQGNPGLLAVQQVGAVGLLAGYAGHGVVVGTGSGLGDRGAGDAGALHVLDRVHDHFLLVFGAEVDDVGDGVEVGNEGKRYAGELMELLYQKNLGELVYRNAANLFGKAQVHEAGLAVGHGGLYADVVVNLVSLLYCFVGEVAGCVLMGAFNEKLLLVGKLEIHNMIPSLFPFRMEPKTGVNPNLQLKGYPSI